MLEHYSTKGLSLTIFSIMYCFEVFKLDLHSIIFVGVPLGLHAILLRLVTMLAFETDTGDSIFNVSTSKSRNNGRLNVAQFEPIKRVYISGFGDFTYSVNIIRSWLLFLVLLLDWPWALVNWVFWSLEIFPDHHIIIVTMNIRRVFLYKKQTFFLISKIPKVNFT